MRIIIDILVKYAVYTNGEYNPMICNELVTHDCKIKSKTFQDLHYYT